MNEMMTQKIEMLLDKIAEDYANWCQRAKITNKTQEEFRENLQLIIGNKYIKVTERGERVWGFVVNTDVDKKFKFGDILMAAGWKAPARNHARGNVIQEEFGAVRWTGPAYMR